MFLKFSIKTALLVLVCAAFALVSYAQTAPVSGEVKIKKADGTVVPAAGMTVEAYRTDIDKGKMPTAKTNKKGEFNFVGFMLGQSYCLVVSGPGINPELRPNVKAGTDNISIEASEGDGKTWTEDQVRAALKGAAAPQGNGGGGQQQQLTAEQKKQQEEALKKNEEITKNNKKIEDTNKVINAALKEGNDAYKAQNYDLALAKYDEGYKADPEFAGSAPIFLRNKGLVLQDRGITTYRAGAAGDATAKAAAIEKAKADYTEATAAFEKAIEILDKVPATDANAQAAAVKSKTETLRNYVGLQGTMAKMGLDPAKTAEASTVILDKYVAAETDDTKKIPALMSWSNYMRESGNVKNAVHGYRLILEKAPDNADAIGGLGLSLFADGVASVPENREEEQEGLNLMQKFADSAPDTHPLKASVKEAVDYLKNTAKLAPQKAGPAPKKKGQ